jgi:2-C-methyl-D-erythritol 4-phosphate cytidylyltransferase
LETIHATYEAAASFESAVPVVDVVETIRHVIDDKDSKTVPRSEYRLVQTPQVFSASLLRNAYKQPYMDFFTDDASVVERFGHSVTLVPGNRENIKITTPFDLAIATALL